ncbi:MAG: hypothetical protein JXR31_02380 [Prolixibacteraceae bacterium]|nr:hypothetical protein [Prolixibacteraceae bacterium]MBN2773069.1 hypothetical protein [Prolixibacteraceae bacterium]
MGRQKRANLIAVLILFPAVLFAQFNNNTTSPYSRFGLGDLQRGSTGRASAMGSAGIGSRNNQQINLLNPASFTSTDSLSFLFDFGFKASFSGFKNELDGFKTNDINFNYFSFSFPVTNWLGVGMGISPFSDMGYDVQMIEEEETYGKVWHRYNGDGSISKAQFGIGIEPIKNISVGANVYYLFGKLVRNANVSFLEEVDFYSDQKYEQIRMRDFGISYGLQATLPFTEKKQLTLGLTFENKPEFTSFHSDITRILLSNGTTTDIDTIINIDEVKDIIRLPQNYGIGLSFVNNGKLEVNLDYIHQKWSQAEFFGEKNPFLTDLDRYAFGIEYIPDYYSIRSYFDKVAYRAGIRYENYYLIFGDQQLTDVGISFGVGLPIYRSLSMINLSAELGKRGKITDNLIREYYAKFTLSVNLYDIWFIKRKYD